MLCCKLIDNPFITEASGTAVALDVLDRAGKRRRAVFYGLAAETVRDMRAGDPVAFENIGGGNHVG